MPKRSRHGSQTCGRTSTTRQDTSGDNFRIELDGQTLDNRGIAGELIVRRAEKMKNRFGDDVRIGRFAGFDLFLRPGFNDTVEVVLRGKNSYSARVTDTALGTIRSLEATVQGFEERAAKLESDIADSHKRAKELESKVGAPFEKEERYQQLSRRQSEIEEKLDLTKNQAPSQAEAESPDEDEKISRPTKQNSPDHAGVKARLDDLLTECSGRLVRLLFLCIGCICHRSICETISQYEHDIRTDRLSRVGRLFLLA